MMEFDEIVVKESPGLCRCCLSEGCYKDMGTEYTWMNENEVYADMLLECFDISISQHNEGPNGPNRLICEVCITRLRDACNFKKQVLDSEKKFVDMVGRGEFRPKVLIYQSQMKSEANDEAEVLEGAEVEYLEDIDFGDGDDEPLKNEASSSEIAVETLAVPKRGRPRKGVKSEKKKTKQEERPKTSKALVKGANALEAVSSAGSVQLSPCKRNRLMKSNAILILEHSTAVPFKWHRHEFLCFFCHKTFKDINLLIEHVKNHETTSIKSAVSYLRGDVKVKIDVTTLSCSICKSNMPKLDDLIGHLKDVHKMPFHEEYGYGVVPYRLVKESLSCALCDKQFEYFSMLNHHMNQHYGCYVCETCGRSFLSQDRLRCHASTHSSVYHCKDCSKSFETFAQKTAHDAKVHDKVFSVKCNFCPRTFKNYYDRKNHHSSAHNQALEKHDCPVCGKCFKIRSKMKTHYNQVHVGQKNFSCPICELRFFSQTHVDRHMIRHVGERIHQCEVCLKSYARKQTLRDHMKIHAEKKV